MSMSGRGKTHYSDPMFFSAYPMMTPVSSPEQCVFSEHFKILCKPEYYSDFFSFLIKAASV